MLKLGIQFRVKEERMKKIFSSQINLKIPQVFMPLSSYLHKLYYGNWCTTSQGGNT